MEKGGSSAKGSDSKARRAHFTDVCHALPGDCDTAWHLSHHSPRAPLSALHIAIIGTGKLGRALASALAAHGLKISGPFSRADLPLAAHAGNSASLEVVLLAVPERALADVARAIPPGRLVGHCSASASLDLLAPHERFNMHPLMTLNSAGARPAIELFRGAACAIDGSTAHARHVASDIATQLGMRAVMVPAEQRSLYHAAASMAANYLVTLEHAAETLAAAAGITRAELAPLAQASLEAWVAGGFHAAISGPVSRGDHDIVRAQRDAIASNAPTLLPMFDVMTDATRRLVTEPATAASLHTTPNLVTPP